MLSTPSQSFLRYVLWADAISCLACGLLQVAFTGYLSQHLGLPSVLLAGTGDFLLLYGASVAFLATRTQVSGAIIWLLIVGNFSWGLACVGLLLANDVHPTSLGKGYVVVQALTVLILARLQYMSVRSHKVYVEQPRNIAGSDDTR
jgi:hypothetical protein